MSVDRKFSSCLQLLERLFDSIHQNVFVDDEQFSIGFVVISLVFVSFLLLLGYTVANADRDIATGAAIVLFSTFQVCIPHEICILRS